MNTNSIPETQTAKAKDENRPYPSFVGTPNSKDYTRDIFVWPENHVVYVVVLQDCGLGFDVWSVKEEHILQTGFTFGKDDIKRDYLHIIVYTKEGGQYTLEQDAFMTTVGARREADVRNKIEEIQEAAQRAAMHVNTTNDCTNELHDLLFQQPNLGGSK